MKPDEALRILDQVAGSVKLTRADHQKVSLASRTLAEAIKPKDKKKK